MTTLTECLMADHMCSKSKIVHAMMLCLHAASFSMVLNRSACLMLWRCGVQWNWDVY